MKKLFTSVLLLALSLQGFAQTAKEQIFDNIKLSASNYIAYVDPDPAVQLTPAPKGYEPFYLTHYGRHGSRWLINDRQYTDVIKTLESADQAGKLTDDGKKVLSLIKEFYPTSINRLGELTTVGERQHHRIGKRLTEHFPEVFSGNAQVDARSTVVIRCILSMEAECEELMRFNPDLKIHNDVSESFQYYLNEQQPKNSAINSAVAKTQSISDAYVQKYVHPERICKQLFNDETYTNNNLNKVLFMRSLFTIASNLQSHDTNIDLYPYFTKDELYDLWRANNVNWYLGYGAAPQTDKMGPFRERNLLKNFIATADTIVNNRDFHGATLRFGHETCLMPLSCLLELGNCGKVITDLDNLEAEWKNFDIFPMAGNVQLIMYRPKKGDGDILVKALLNEKEVSLPVTAVSYPYYKWSDLRDYYLKKLENYDNKK